jgi:hypothetical protein
MFQSLRKETECGRAGKWIKICLGFRGDAANRRAKRAVNQSQRDALLRTAASRLTELV